MLLCQHRRLRYYEVDVVAVVAVRRLHKNLLSSALVYGHTDSI